MKKLTKDAYEECKNCHYLANLFHTSGLILYLQKASENQRFSDVLRGYRKRTVPWNGLKRSHITLSKILMTKSWKIFFFFCLKRKWLCGMKVQNNSFNARYNMSLVSYLKSKLWSYVDEERLRLVGSESKH